MAAAMDGLKLDPLLAPERALGRRAAAGGAGEAGRRGAGADAARRADQPSRRPGDRLAGGASRRDADGVRGGEPRPGVPEGADRPHALGRPRRRCGGWSAASRRSRSGATRSSRRRTRRGTSSTASSGPRAAGRSRGSRRGASATWGGCGGSPSCAPSGGSRSRRAGTARLAFEGGPLSGKLVVEAAHVAKRFGGRTIVRDFSIRIGRGERVAMVGPNGVGKTTLLDILTGALAPDEGRVRLGANLVPAVFDQNRAALDPELTLWETLTGDAPGGSDQVMVRGRPRHVVGYLKEFLFAEAQAQGAGVGAVGRRAGAAAAGAADGEGVEPAGARRADQRPRRRDARPAGGAGRRVRGHRARWSATTATSSTGWPRPRSPWRATDGR